MADDAAGKNGRPRRTGARVKQVVDYNEKRHLEELEEDIQHGVVHATDEPPSSSNELEEHVNDLGESWETESIFADILDDLAEDKIFTDSEYYFFFYSPPSPHSPFSFESPEERSIPLGNAIHSPTHACISSPDFLYFPQRFAHQALIMRLANHTQSQWRMPARSPRRSRTASFSGR